ncbi:ABC transporter ATP-binding protein [Streptococcus halotolerans]|uniref:ABC transporter ATP-binding protein n=1 Tax=Streptococcus halotolerans TaxID=1814128 RepID=UPI0007871812|nr:ABC transporter ATP-binding protein [Streptococcus halotolerans]
MFFYLKRRYKENLLLLAVIIVSIILKLRSAFLTAEAFNSLLAGETDSFLSKVILCASLYFGYVVLFAFQTWYDVFVRQKMIGDIRSDISSSYAMHRPNQSSEYTSGKMVSWLTTDSNRISNEGFKRLYTIVEAIIEVLLSVFALAFLNWKLMLVIVALAIINLILPKLADKKLASVFGKLTLSQENFTASIANLYNGFTCLFSLNKQDFLVSKSDKEIQSIQKAEIDSYKIVGVATFLAAFGNVLGQIGSLMISGIFVAQKMLTFGDILSVSNISVNIFNGVSNLSSNIIEIKAAFPIFEKHKKFLNASKEEQLNDNMKLKNVSLNTKIELNKVNLTLGNNEILSNASYTFKKGKKYCIVGPSGTGKSTLLKLLTGSLNYDSGTIELDDQALKAINGSSLRSQITYVEQTPYIFNGTIRENITLTNDFSDEEIESVIQKVCLTNDISQLSKGLDTLIGEGALDLSGGQKQRISLARAILNGSQFLLLDESTSNLNKALAQSIEKELLSDDAYSLIVITHHLSEEMKPYFDDIISLENGKLVSQATT